MHNLSPSYAVLVVGGGHAGTEAALAAARQGLPTLLLTQQLATVGAMSCNPAIGGIGKSHLVREIDALGGVMARAADRAAIQLRVLNASKGPAVRATRAQADRTLYREAIRAALAAEPTLELREGEVVDFLIAGARVTGAALADGTFIRALAVVLTAGTFLGGRLHVGLEESSGGRVGDSASTRLAARLRELALPVGRLKTGTPPRLDGRSIDFTTLAVQGSDTPLPVLSYLGRPADHPRQVPCHLTATNERTHAIIRGARDRSPLYTGRIGGLGPRYCPSIEDKVSRFAARTSHQIFLEPEGLATDEIYPNGISTSLPPDVQEQMVRSIRGLEHARLTRPGYAIEYDFYDPRSLAPSLESKHFERLFLAGQVNGTTGYEEAAAQGLIAGLNAGRAARGEAPWWPRRSQAYIGVLIDDLVTRGAPEPYRMFTSRAEYRLSLREDNADERLTAIGRGLGLVDDERFAFFERKSSLVRAELARLTDTRLRADDPELAALLGMTPARELRALELLRRPGLDYRACVGLAQVGPAPAGAHDERLARQVPESVEVAAKYEGYLARQADEIARLARHEHTHLPGDLDYTAVTGLSNEIRERLDRVRPATVGQAARVPGVTQDALSLLLVHLRRRAS
jgi:tRNA uridine 5-carboxymethylaminomethyl modification enzyme